MAQQLADRLHQARRDMKWDQGELAQRSGISRGYISEIERGIKTNIGADIVVALASALGVTVPYLLGLTDDPLGEGNERVLREQSGDYVVFEVDAPDQRRIVQQVVDLFTRLTNDGQAHAIRYLSVLLRLEQEESRATIDPAVVRRWVSFIEKLDAPTREMVETLIEMNSVGNGGIAELRRLLDAT